MLFVALFVCLCLFICVAIAYISRSFVLSNQIEFAVLWNTSLVTFNTAQHCMSSDLCAGYMSSGLFTDYT